MTNFDYLKQWAQRYADRKKAEGKNPPAGTPEDMAPESKYQNRGIFVPSLQGVSFLGDNLGREVHKEIEKRYKDFSFVTENVSFKDNIIKGSKPYYVVAVNEVLRGEGIRTATQADLERILKENKLPLKDHYEDGSLVWRSDVEPNSYLAQNISAQLRKRNMPLNAPIIIPLYCLDMVKDNQAPNELAFKIREDAQVISAPILTSADGSQFSSDDIELNTGIPKKLDSNGDRYLWTKSSGLSGLCLGRSLGIDSSGDNLAASSVDGRVVLVSAAGAAPKK